MSVAAPSFTRDEKKIIVGSKQNKKTNKMSTESVTLQRYFTPVKSLVHVLKFIQRNQTTKQSIVQIFYSPKLDLRRWNG